MISSTTNTPPTFSSLLSGLYPIHHGVRTHKGPPLRRNVPTLPALLKSHGYSTYAFVTGPLLETFGLNKGFDIYQHRERKKNIYSPWANSLRKFIQNLPHSPWFMLLHFFEVHRPRQTNGIQTKSEKKKYAIAWKSLDKQIGQLLKLLPKDTLVVLTADHGEAIERRSDQTLRGQAVRKIRDTLNMPRRPIDYKNHGHFLFDELVRIPFVIRGPGIEPGRVIRQQVRQIDIMPTLLALSNIDMNFKIDGLSMLPLIQGGKKSVRPALMETGDRNPLRHWQGLRKPDWKFIQNQAMDSIPSPRKILFHLKTDPGEQSNVADHYPDIANQMEQQLHMLTADEDLCDSDTALSPQEQKKLETLLKHLGYM